MPIRSQCAAYSFTTTHQPLYKCSARISTFVLEELEISHDRDIDINFNDHENETFDRYVTVKNFEIYRANPRMFVVVKRWDREIIINI